MIGLQTHQNRLQLFVPYEDRNLAKSISGYRWNKRFQCWEYPLNSDSLREICSVFDTLPVSDDIRDEMRKHTTRLEGLRKLKTEAFNNPDQSKFLNYKFFEHQSKSYTFFRNTDTCMDFSEPGAGKTMIQIALMKYRFEKKRIKNVLIICPKSIIDEVWVKDLKAFWLENTIINYKIHTANTFTPNEQKNQVFKGNSGELNVFVVNFERAWRIDTIITKTKWDMIIVDESSRIKSRTAKQTKFILKLKSKYKSIMTGTPAPNGLMDLFSQVKFVDSSIFGTSFYAFRNKYFVPSGYMGYDWVPKPQSNEEIRKLIEPYTVSWRKSDCLDLPAITHQTLECDMSKDQEKVYTEMKNEMLTYIDGETYSAPIAITKMLRLSQISSGFIQNSDGLDRIVFGKNPKLDLLKNQLAEIPKKYKVIIWAVFHQDIETIKKALGDSAVTFYGGTSVGDRKVAIDRFLNDKTVRYFIAHPKSAGHGLNLSVANYAIYYSMDYSYEGYQQSVDRINRIGQTNKMTVYYLTVKKSIDKMVFSALKTKRKLNEFLKDLKNKGNL